MQSSTLFNYKQDLGTYFDKIDSNGVASLNSLTLPEIILNRALTLPSPLREEYFVDEILKAYRNIH